MFRLKDWVLGFFWVPIIGAVLVSSSLRIIFFVALISFSTLAYGFIINNYFDVEIDKKNRNKIKTKKNPLAQGLVTQRGTIFIIGFLLFLPLVLAMRINFAGFFFVAMSVIASTLYSIKNIRLKERPGIDIITHGLMGGFFPFLFGVTLAGGTIDSKFLLLGLLFLLLNCNGLLSHQIIDYEEDLGNTKGTVIKIGRKISFAFLILIQIIFFFLFAIIFRHLLVNIWIYSLFVFLLFWIPLDCVRRAIKASNQLTVRTPKRKEIKDFLQRKLRLIFKYF